MWHSLFPFENQKSAVTEIKTCCSETKSNFKPKRWLFWNL